MKNKPINTIQQNGSRILKYLRFAKGLSQEEMARTFGASRSSYQRMEKGESPLLLQHVVTLNEEFDVSVEDLVLGAVSSEKYSGLDLVNKGISRPYSKNRFSGWPILRVYIDAFRLCHGQKKFDEFCKNLRINPLVFTNKNLKLNINFNIQILQELVLSGHLSSQNDLKILADHYFKSNSMILEKDIGEDLKGVQRVEEFLSLISNYEQNHDYRVEEIGKNSIVFSFRPNDHVDFDIYRANPIINDTMSKWIGYALSNIAGEYKSVSHLESYHKGYERCIYQIKV
jgi:transcriptional regulator with XRE-family HTH domain